MLSAVSNADPTAPRTQAQITCARCGATATITMPGYPTDARLRRVFRDEHGWSIRKIPGLKPQDCCPNCTPNPQNPTTHA